MNSIEQLLGDLLLRHNCVIVPSFGGFVAKQVSAKIDFASGKMLPPSKSLLFNKQLINNDGLLINEFAQLNNLSYDEAVLKVQEKVSDWNKVLSSGNRIELDRIGYLFLDAEKNLCFEQDRFFNLLLESFGLGQVHFLTEEDVMIAERAVARIENEESEWTPEKENVPTEKVISEKPVIEPAVVLETVERSSEEVATPVIPIQQGKKKRVWRYIAAACILPIAFYSIWIPMKTDVLESGVISLNDFNPFHSRTEGVYEQQELQPSAEKTEEPETLEEQIESLGADVDTYTYAYDDDTNVSVVLEKEEEVAEEEFVEQPSEQPVEEPQFEAIGVQYIVGCFGDKTNATNLVSKLKSEGLDARIFDFHNGLHRVTAGAAISEEILAQIKSKADALGFPGWVLK